MSLHRSIRCESCLYRYNYESLGERRTFELNLTHSFSAGATQYLLLVAALYVTGACLYAGKQQSDSKTFYFCSPII